nr:ribose 5-phosphate isomerase B [Rubinisphaera italica]
MTRPNRMKVAVASDHRGFDLKARIVDRLTNLGHEAIDMGPGSGESVDYPDFAVGVSKAVANKEADRGILICGTGMGMCIAANKIKGIRATACHDEVTAEMSRRHNDANVLCLSAELLGEQLVDRMIEIWVTTEFEGGRHARRLDKISDFESHE